LEPPSRFLVQERMRKGRKTRGGKRYILSDKSRSTRKREREREIRKRGENERMADAGKRVRAD